MPGLLNDVDPDGLLEYSVVFTDRSLNHMSQAFQQVMRNISATLKQVYNAQAVAVVPGGGTYAMEAVARQLGTGRKCLVIRNGWFSFRWSQIFEMGHIPSAEIVLKARRTSDAAESPFVPAPIDEVVATIRAEQPAVVFAPHVETSAGMLLPDNYLKAVADAVHEVGGLFVLDCIASGTLWVDMQAVGIDVLISAPQKGWSATPCAGLVMMNDAAEARVNETTSTSFAADLKKWLQIMQAYENGGHAYHATMPTDGLRKLEETMQEMQQRGFATLKQQQLELGARVRELLTGAGYKSVAGAGFQASGVVVSYTRDSDIQTGKKFISLGLQIAAGVPLQCDEPANFKTFRVGLFGLDKLADIGRTVNSLAAALTAVA
ncbi:MAG: alanine--glyoxylate aminotransferase family protein [Gammaproteobacteria bacterium]|nr:alanine--glyoxylate aminotransferase family protein [Gammaproteobacteria bacterium]